MSAITITIITTTKWRAVQKRITLASDVIHPLATVGFRRRQRNISQSSCLICSLSIGEEFVSFS
jgi:hypothetical protein